MVEVKNVLIIVNPCSGRMTGLPKNFNFGEKFTQEGFEADVRITTGCGDATEIARSLSKNYDIIVCRGGDGTLNEVINGIMQSGRERPIGYIPAGTTNDFASTYHIPTDVDEAIDIIINGNPTERDIGSFNENTYFNYSASFGVFSKSSYATPQKLKNRYGHFAYLVYGAKEVRDIKNYNIKMTCDGKEVEGEYAFVNVTNALTVGGLMKYDKNLVDFNDGLFEVVLAKKPSSFAELAKLVLSVRNGKMEERYFTLMQGREITFECEEEIPWSLDGEFGGLHRDVNIKCLKSAVSIYTKC